MEHRTILLPTDFSDSSRNAIEYGLKLYAGRGYHFVLLNTVEPKAASGTGMMMNLSQMVIDDSKAGLQNDLDWITEKKLNDGNTIEAIHMTGAFSQCIRAVVKKKQAFTIVVGTTGASGLKEFFVGSKAAEIIQESPVPVLTVPFNAVYKTVKSVVFATDLNKIDNIELLEFLKNLLIRQSATLSIFHVEKSISRVKVEDRNEQKKLLIKYFDDVDVEYETLVNEDTVEGVNEYIKKHKQADILVMVPRKKNFFEKIFTKSVAKKVAYHSHVPMLTLHKK
ncbi:MAG: nucleotide-binding universal stress UspA family protein [Salibacteraceae bacterium]|jgi:nucleotide-binding universal stress UspA family protein